MRQIKGIYTPTALEREKTKSIEYFGITVGACGFLVNMLNGQDHILFNMVNSRNTHSHAPNRE